MFVNKLAAALAPRTACKRGLVPSPTAAATAASPPLSAQALATSRRMVKAAKTSTLSLLLYNLTHNTMDNVRTQVLY
jgi:hypothetical protein